MKLPKVYLELGGNMLYMNWSFLCYQSELKIFKLKKKNFKTYKNSFQGAFFFFSFFVFLGLHPQHMEVPRLGVQSEM